MQGTSKKAFKWIHPDDEAAPTEQQTVWYLKALGGFDAARIRKLYTEAESTGRRNQVRINEGKALKADKEMFLRCVDKVENFCFSRDYEELHKQGYITFSDDDTILKCGADLDMDVFNDIIEAASRGGRLEETARKK